MRQRRLLLLAAAALVLFVKPPEAEAQWLMIKGSLQEQVQIVKETEQRIVLYHAAHEVLLVITAAKEADSDIYGGLEVRRGGNPYRVWITTEKFLQKFPERRSLGDLFFRQSFVKALKREEVRVDAAPPSEMKIETTSSDSILARTTPEPPTPPEAFIENFEPVVAVAESTVAPVRENVLPSIPATRPPEKKARKAADREGKSRTGLGRLDNRRLKTSEQITPLPQSTPPRESTNAAVAGNKADSTAVVPQNKNAEAATAFDTVLTPKRSEPRNVTWPLFGSKASSLLYFTGGIVAVFVLPVLTLMFFSPRFRARLCLWRDDYETALRIYERALERHPGRVKLNAGLADLYLLLGRSDARAMQVYKTVLRLNLKTSYREKINALVAQQLLSEGRTDPDAIEILEKALNSELLRQNRGDKK